MRLNKYIALHTSHSRRSADALISEGKVEINGAPALPGQEAGKADTVKIAGKIVAAKKELVTIMLNKPRGYVCSREGQGSKTIYELLPQQLRHLNSVGRLDKDSSGLLLLTNDGELANRLTHPRYEKIKVYDVKLNKPLQPQHRQMISDDGLPLEDGLSKLQIEVLDKKLRISMKEGKNRQIRRTFQALDYQVTELHRIKFGNYQLGDLAAKEIKII